MLSVFSRWRATARVPLIAYHHDPAVKARYIARIRTHRLADDLVKGFYWMHGKGCAVGCTLEDSDHRRYETELGIPVRIAYLEDAVFEGLPNAEARMFPERFLEAIPPGGDLSSVPDAFLASLMSTLRLNPVRFPKASYAVGTVQALCRSAANHMPDDPASWKAAAEAIEAGMSEGIAAAYPRVFMGHWVVTFDPADPAGEAALIAMDSAKLALVSRADPAAAGSAVRKAMELADRLESCQPGLAAAQMADILIALLKAAPMATCHS
jgi:hypothetical protein